MPIALLPSIEIVVISVTTCLRNLYLKVSMPQNELDENNK